MPFISEADLAWFQKMVKQRAILRDAIIKVQYEPNLTEEQERDLREALEKVGVF